MKNYQCKEEMIVEKVSRNMYDATRKIGKIAQVTNDIEDVVQGKTGKVVKRHIKRKARKEANKALNHIFKKIGL